MYTRNFQDDHDLSSENKLYGDRISIGDATGANLYFFTLGEIAFLQFFFINTRSLVCELTFIFLHTNLNGS